MSDETFPEKFAHILEVLSPSGYAHTLLRDRPYNGQPHTDGGERGKQEIKGITMRDLCDCYIRACYHSSGLPTEQYPKSLYELPWDEMDPLAISQNLTCEVEKLMGIFPNLPKRMNLRDHIPRIELPSDEEVPRD